MFINFKIKKCIIETGSNDNVRNLNNLLLRVLIEYQLNNVNQRRINLTKIFLIKTKLLNPEINNNLNINTIFENEINFYLYTIKEIQRLLFFINDKWSVAPRLLNYFEVC